MPVPAVLFLDEIADGHAVGGKARGLARLLAAGFPVPAGFVAAPEATPGEIAAAYRRLGARRIAVRSSAEEEDGERFSYAGQFARCCAGRATSRSARRIRPTGR